MRSRSASMSQRPTTASSPAGSSRRLAARGRCRVSRPLLEALEDRCLLSFSPAVSYPVGTTPQAVVTADFNGDNRLDIASANSGSNTVTVLRGNGNGTFQAAQVSATGNAPRSIAVGDFNRDGRLDVVTTNAEDLSVLLGNGDGTLQAPLSFTLPAQFPPGYDGATGLPQRPTSVAVGDVNGDGTLDLAVTGITSFTRFLGSGYYGNYYEQVAIGHANVLLGRADGTFAPTRTSLLPGTGSYSVALGDFNGDRLLDVATANGATADGTGAGVSVLLGNGDGTLQPPRDSGSGLPAYSMAVGDLDGDGLLDLATTNGGGGVRVFHGNGDGTLRTGSTSFAGDSASSVAVGDVNRDGSLDIVTTSNTFECTSSGYYGCYDGVYHGAAQVLMGRGDGSFAAAQGFAAGAYATDVALGDFNGDLYPDLAVTEGGNASVLINNADWPPVPPALSISGVTVTEGDAGSVNAVFTVRLSSASTRAVTVNFATGDSGATAGLDYSAASGTLTFAPGVTEMTISVPVLGDVLDEYDEQFVVTLSGAANAEISVAQAIATILDNDPPPTISIADASILEGDRGTKTMTFTVRLSTSSGKSISVDYATADDTATTADGDYFASYGTLYFAPGETIKTFTVVIRGDTKQEPDETFFIYLSGAADATIADGQAIGTIRNDDKKRGNKRS